MPVTMMPVGATGDSEPDVAPWPTMIAMRNAGIRARAATVIAIGAMSAVVAMCPGPTDASTQPSAKNMTGTRPALPRHKRSARSATFVSVPFCWAWVNSNVTPASVRNNETGKPAITSFTPIPP